MQRINFVLVWLCLPFFAIAQQQPSAQGLMQYRQQFEKGLAFWQATFSDFKLEDFKISEGTQGFTGKVVRSFAALHDMDSAYILYRPMLAFAQDSNLFIDLYSQDLALERQGDSVVAYANPGGSVLLCDRAKLVCISILVYGHSWWIDDAMWLDETHFMLAGVVFSDFGITGSPVLYVGNTRTHMLQLYVNKNPKCLQQIEGYSGHKYKDLHINGL